MKKWFCMFWAAVIVCCMASVDCVQADVIWTPEDSFYMEHASECTHVNRVFTADGPDGVVILYQNPESAQVTGRLENGVTAVISFTYEDGGGVVWGVYESGDGKETGWMPMDYMKVVYDSISFAEECAAEIIEQTGVLGGQYAGAEIYRWEYPGAEQGSVITVESSQLPQYGRAYVDEEGRSWGNVAYYFGYRNVWVCIDQPTADFNALYPNGAPKRGRQEETTDSMDSTHETQRIVPKKDYRMVAWAVGMTLLAVLVTIGLLVVLMRGGKNNRSS